MKIKPFCRRSIILGHVAVCLLWQIIIHAVPANATVYKYAIDNNKGLIAIEVVNRNGKVKRIRSWAKTTSDYQLPENPLAKQMLPKPSANLEMQKEILFHGDTKKIKIQLNDQSYQQFISADAKYNRIIATTNGRISNRILVEPKAPIFDASELLYSAIAGHEAGGQNLNVLAQDKPIFMEWRRGHKVLLLMSSTGKALARIVLNKMNRGVPQQFELMDVEDPRRINTRIQLKSVERNATEIGKHTTLIKAEAFIPFMEERSQRNISHDRSFERRSGRVSYVTTHAEKRIATTYLNGLLRDKLQQTGVLLEGDAYRYIRVKLNNHANKILATISKKVHLKYDANTPVIVERKDKIRRMKRNVKFYQSIQWSITKGSMLNAVIPYSYDQELDDSYDIKLISDAAKRYRKAYQQPPDYYKYNINGQTIKVMGMKEKFFFDKKLGTVELSLRGYWDRLRHRLRLQKRRFDREISHNVKSRTGTLTLRYRTLLNDRTDTTVRLDLAEPYRRKYFIEPDNFALRRKAGGAKIWGIIDTTPDKSVDIGEVVGVLLSKFSKQSSIRKTKWFFGEHKNHMYIKRKAELEIPVHWSAINSVLMKKYDIMEEESFNMVSGNELRCNFIGFEKM